MVWGLIGRLVWLGLGHIPRVHAYIHSHASRCTHACLYTPFLSPPTTITYIEQLRVDEEGEGPAPAHGEAVARVGELEVGVVGAPPVVRFWGGGGKWING